MAAIRVADLDDPRLARYRGVRDPDLLRAHGAFIAEGRLIVERLLTDSRFRAQSVLLTPTARTRLAPALEKATCPVYVVEPALIEHLAGYNIHRGALAIGERGPLPTVKELAALPGPLVCLEAIGNPDNIGGVFRAAAAFSASGVLLSPGCSDPLYRKSIRTSMGAVLGVPFTIAETWPAVITWFRDQGWTVLALTPARDAVDVRLAAATIPSSRVALLLGHEGNGLTAEAQAMASLRVRIPISPAVDSLNVATAAAITLYEVISGRFRPRPRDPPR